MSIAITDDHRALAETAADLLAKRDARGAARALLEAPTSRCPRWWDELAGLGWLGLHVPEEHGGSGYGARGARGGGRGARPGGRARAVRAHGDRRRRVLAAVGGDAAEAALLPGLADGSLIGAVALGGDVTVSGGTASGDAGNVLGGGLAQVLLVAVGRRRRRGRGRRRRHRRGAGQPRPHPPLGQGHPRRRPGRPSCPAPGGRWSTWPGVILSAEAVGMARECTEHGRASTPRSASSSAGRSPCSRRSSTTAPTWSWPPSWPPAPCGTRPAPPPPAATSSPTPRPWPPRSPAPAADLCANLNTQVHGGIAITWEHDAHLYLRRATVLLAVPRCPTAPRPTLDRPHPSRCRAASKAVELPPEAEAIRDRGAGVRRAHQGPVRRGAAHRADRVGLRACRTGPSRSAARPAPSSSWWSSRSSRAAGVKRPAYGITGWNILTLIQYATEDQVARWVRPALNQDVIWCQLFSEPDAGSDAAGVKTKATRVDGGWLVNGQKVWTSGAHVAGLGFATVRTNPDVPKHDGITTMVIDMHAEGVEVRPLKMTSGDSEFNEVFFNDVFVPDDDVVGPVDGGWTVARATLGNESVSIGGGDGGMSLPGAALIAALRRAPRPPRRRRRPRRPLHRRPPGHGPAEPAQRQPGGRRWRSRPRGRHDQARSSPRTCTRPRPSHRAARSRRARSWTATAP